MFRKWYSGWIAVGLIALLLAGLAVAAAAGAPALAPLRLIPGYSWGLLAQEAKTIADCTAAGCHRPADMHTCARCHDAHGDAYLSSVPWSNLLLLTGDVPQPGYIPINDILPYHEITRTAMPLLAFLSQHGVDDFESVTFTSGDGGLVTVAREDLGSGSLLLPYADGVRFADEKLHVSAWLRGIDRIVVVGREKPLQVGGTATSIGRLLLGSTRWVTVEQAVVMLQDPQDRQVRRAQTAMRIEGVPLADLLAGPVWVRNAEGEERSLTAEESRSAVLAVVFGDVALVIPGQGRGQWVRDVVEIRNEK